MAGDSGTFSCASCGRRFAYKAQMAGKRVKCACGNVFAVKLQTAEEEYDLAPEGPVRGVAPAQALPVVTAQAGEGAAGSELASAPMSAAASTPARQTRIDQSRVLQYAHKKPRGEADLELEKVSRLKTVYLPAALIVTGVGLRVAPFFVKGIMHQGMAVMVLAAVGALAVNVVLMLCGVLIASQFLDADFGSLRSAVLKLIATAVVGGGAAGWLLSLDWSHGGIQGPLLALHAMILIYWIMFAMFFELDLLENLFTVAIVMGLHIVAFCAVFGSRV
jgi:hypothetical protein